MRIIVVAGASGGHIFPAISFLSALKKRQQGIEAVLVLPKKNIKYAVIPGGWRLRQISVTALGVRPDLANLKALFNFIKGWIESLFIFFEFRPDVVAGFGSLSSVPLIFWAWLFRARTIIHEQNVVPGRANRLLAGFSDRVALSFEETKNYLKGGRDKFILSGNPLRQQLQRIDRAKALDFFGFGGDKFTILVSGGSQASHKINLAFIKALALIPGPERLQVIHICGEQDFAYLNQAYASVGLQVKLYGFLDQMQYGYSAADLAVSRAGATTVAELIFFRLPAIIIPYPFAYQHQQANAAILEQRGAAKIIRDDCLTPQALAQEINRLLERPGELAALRQGFGNAPLSDAAGLLTEAVLSLAKD